MRMTCNIDKSTAAKIARHLETGAYKSPEAVVDAALDALDGVHADPKELRRLIMQADADIAAGRVRSYDSAEELVADVIASGEKRLSRDA